MTDAGFKLSVAAVKRLGLRCKQSRKYKATTDSKHSLPVAPNLLNRQFANGTAPNQAWVADITYIETGEGWLYLAVLKDLFTCAMDSYIKAELVNRALFMAVKAHKPAPGLIVHSDRAANTRVRITGDC